MIVTLTMNPAVDKTVYIDWLRTGQLNRISRKALDAGGKGINAARMLRVLGCECIAAGIAGGSAGRFIEDTLENEGIRTDFLHIEEETRTNEKIIEENGTMTELNEPGPLLTPEILGRCQEKLSAYAGPDTVFVISGSIPQGVSPDYYAHLIRLLKRKGSRVILDADGELLRLGIEAQPDAVKPNLQELSSYFGLGAGHALSEEELMLCALQLSGKGIPLAAISLGAQGALFVKGRQLIRCPGLTVRALSPVGAGDAMAASLAYCLERGVSFEDTARLCIAASAASATTPGTRPPEKALIDQLLPKVELIRA